MPSTRTRPAIDFDEIQQSHQLVQPRTASSTKSTSIASASHNPRHRIDGIHELAASLQAYGLL